MGEVASEKSLFPCFRIELQFALRRFDVASTDAATFPNVGAGATYSGVLDVGRLLPLTANTYQCPLPVMNTSPG